MANATHCDPKRTGLSGPPRHTAADDTPRNEATSQTGGARAPETRDMQRMAQENAQLLGNLRSRVEPADAADLNALRRENAELRSKLEELEQLIQGPDGIEAAWAERQREYEALLEEKSEVIRELHLKVQELQSAVPAAAPAQAESAATADPPATAPPATERPPAERPAAELAATDVSAKEVLDLQRQLEEERRQLKDDEETLMSQMRDMEMALARDRAELARHRAELQRLHNDLNRELENANRDSGLRERLLALTRRPPQDTVAKAKLTQVLPKLPGAKPPTESAPQTTETKKPNSGFFRRMFGG